MGKCPRAERPKAMSRTTVSVPAKFVSQMLVIRTFRRRVAMTAYPSDQGCGSTEAFRTRPHKTKVLGSCCDRSAGRLASEATSQKPCCTESRVTMEIRRRGADHHARRERIGCPPNPTG